jgi:hypothetical protein
MCDIEAQPCPFLGRPVDLRSRSHRLRPGGATRSLATRSLRNPPMDPLPSLTCRAGGSGPRGDVFRPSPAGFSPTSSESENRLISNPAAPPTGSAFGAAAPGTSMPRCRGQCASRAPGDEGLPQYLYPPLCARSGLFISYARSDSSLPCGPDGPSGQARAG